MSAVNCFNCIREAMLQTENAIAHAEKEQDMDHVVQLLHYASEYLRKAYMDAASIAVVSPYTDGYTRLAMK